MQNEIENTTTTETTQAAEQPAPFVTEPTAAPAPVSSPATEAPAKPKRVRSSKPATANGKAAAKRVTAKQAAKPSKPAKPTQADREAAQRAANDMRHMQRAVAHAAVSAFYSGASKPFKAAADRFADINPSNGKAATARQAALALALITYGAGNMRGDGTFTRGGFRVPAKLINASAKPGETVLAQPESGCLGNMLGRACDFVSGPRSGREQTQAVYRLRVPVVIREIQAAFGDKPAKAAAALLAGYGKRAA